MKRKNWPLIVLVMSLLSGGCKNNETPDPGPVEEPDWEYPDPYADQDWAIWSDESPRLPALDAQGGLIYGDWTGRLRRVHSESGEIDWEVDLGATINSSPAVEDGVIYVADWDGGLSAFDLSGQLSWRYDTNARHNHSPTIDGENNIWVGDDDGYLHILNSAGELVKAIDLDAPITSAVSIYVANGQTTAYVATADDHLHCFHDDEQRSHKLGGEVGFDIALTDDGDAFVTTHNGRAALIDKNCDLIWEEDYTYATIMPAIIGDDGNPWAWAHRRTLYQFDVETGELLEKPDALIRANATTAPVLAEDGRVFVSTEGVVAYKKGQSAKIESRIDVMDGLILFNGAAFATTHQGALVRLSGSWPALSTSSSWPTQHGNQARTGRLER